MSKERKKNKKTTVSDSPFLSLSMKLSMIDKYTGKQDNSLSAKKYNKVKSHYFKSKKMASEMSIVETIEEEDLCDDVSENNLYKYDNKDEHFLPRNYKTEKNEIHL